MPNKFDKGTKKVLESIRDNLDGKTDLIDKNELKKIVKDFSKNIKSEITTLSVLEKKSISQIKAKLISYAS